MSVKEVLFNKCLNFVNNRLQTVEKIMLSNQKALQTETKSSAGDKHETGRAMLQLEMEKAGQQLASIHQMKEVLAKINFYKPSKTVHLGSVIETSLANYFLSISAGQLKAKNKVYFAVSVSSPIGRVLLGKKLKDEVVFNGKKIMIKKIE